MTREEAMLKLLAIEPATMASLIVCTGWDVRETVAVVEGLQKQRKIEMIKIANGCEFANRLYRIVA